MKRIDLTHKISWLVALLTISLVTGCGGGKWDAPPATDVDTPVAPTATASLPADQATGIAVTTAVNVTFDAPMDPDTINDTTYTLTGPADASVAGDVTYSAANMTATFTPTAALAFDTTYTAVVTTGAQKLTGEALASSHSWTFTTVPETLAPPTATASFPNDEATNVAVTTAVNVTFDSAMNPATLNATTYTLTGPADAAVAGNVTYAEPNMTATFLPTDDLEFDTTYTAVVTTGAQNATGEALATDHSWTFTTMAPAVVVPTATATLPENEATNVAVTTEVTVTFDAEMDPATFDDVTYTVTGPADAAVAGNVTYDAANMTATFAPVADLEFDTMYTAVVTTGVQSLAGEALAADHSWTFTTVLDAVAPIYITLSETNPPTADTGVCVNRNIHATFSDELEPSTIISPAVAFTLTETLSAMAVNGEVSLDASGTMATFNPTADLNPDTEYTAMVTMDVEDVNGNSLEQAAEWTFTTADSICQETVTLGATLSYGVLSNTSVTLGGGPDSTTGLRVDGDVAIFPAGQCSGCDGTTVSGLIEIGTTAAQQAITDLEAAYNEAVGRTTGVCTLIAGGALDVNPPADCGGNADGVYAPGLYWSGTSMAIPAGATITLDGGNDNNAVFIFQSESTVNSEGGSTRMILSNGAQAKNVFWVAKSSATIGGTDSDFSGTILALIGITVNTGTVMTGRALARGAEVVVQNNATVTVPAE